VPRPCARALDVGCGLGGFARKLSRIADRVDALDSDAAVIDRARDASAGISNLRFVVADFMAWNPGHTYAAVSMIAVLHHLPFRDAIRKAAVLLEPRGTLVVLGLDRAPSRTHALGRGLIGWPLSGYCRLTLPVSPVGAAIVAPAMTLADIREQARPLLPDCEIRSHALWRYSLIWRKPAITRST
jgi:SAM-dependent methyltransferase